MSPGIVDGERWIAERLKFLRGRLSGDNTEAERTAIDAEIEALSQERGLSSAGRRAGWLRRRLQRRA